MALPPSVRAWLPALERAAVPLKAFLARHAHADDRRTFQDLGARMRKHPVADDGLLVLAPAFATSELTEAFAIGFLLLLPFLILDIVIGLVLAALGLTTVSATQVALPLKLLLFVVIDGWRLLAEGLILGYA
jgi:type III secretion protein R